MATAADIPGLRAGSGFGIVTSTGKVTYWLDGKLIVNASVPGFPPSVWTELQWRPIEGGNMGWMTPAAQTETIDGVVVTGY